MEGERGVEGRGRKERERMEGVKDEKSRERDAAIGAIALLPAGDAACTVTVRGVHPPRRR